MIAMSRPETPAERALVAAAITVYRERRAAGAVPSEAWDRATNLVDDTLVRPTVRYEHRMAPVPT